MINIPKFDNIVSLYLEQLILPSDPLKPMWNRENFIFSKPAKWNYIDSALIRSILMLSSVSGDKRLLDYGEKFTDAYVTEDGSIPTLNHCDHNLDNINGGKNLITLYDITGREKYRLGCEKLFSELMTYPRLNCGNFFHKEIYPRQLWLDGSYMTLPFMAEYAVISGKNSVTEDVLSQLKNIVSIMKDPVSGLYYHGYDESRQDIWADKISGLSGEFWLRSMGWFAAALADICEISYPDTKLFSFARNTLSQLLDALSGLITPENMLLQLPTRADLNGNYPESSGTLLFSYSALKLCRLGLGNNKIRADGVRTLSAVIENFMDIKGNTPVLKNICLMAGLGGENRRNGKAEYYLSEPVVENDAKGIAPLIMSYTELKRLVSAGYLPDSGCISTL